MSAAAAKNVRAERAVLAQMAPNLERAAAALLKHERLVAKGVVSNASSSKKGKKGAKNKKSQLPGLEGGSRSDIISLMCVIQSSLFLSLFAFLRRRRDEGGTTTKPCTHTPHSFLFLVSTASRSKRSRHRPSPSQGMCRFRTRCTRTVVAELASASS